MTPIARSTVMKGLLIRMGLALLVACVYLVAWSNEADECAATHGVIVQNVWGWPTCVTSPADRSET